MFGMYICYSWLIIGNLYVTSCILRADPTVKKDLQKHVLATTASSLNDFQRDLKSIQQNGPLSKAQVKELHSYINRVTDEKRKEELFSFTYEFIGGVQVSLRLIIIIIIL